MYKSIVDTGDLCVPLIYGKMVFSHRILHTAVAVVACYMTEYTVLKFGINHFNARDGINKTNDIYYLS